MAANEISFKSVLPRKSEEPAHEVLHEQAIRNEFYTILHD